MKKRHYRQARLLRHAVAYAIAGTVIAQTALVLVSWVVTSICPEKAIRPLLSADGIRWQLGKFTENMASEPLVLLLMFCIAAGTFIKSGLPASIRREERHYRQRYALRLIMAETAVYIIVMSLLTLVPHAILLSVTGDLFPSSFSHSIGLQATFMTCVIALTYGMVTRTLRSIDDITDALSAGIKWLAPVILLYFFLQELLLSVKYVMMW